MMKSTNLSKSSPSPSKLPRSTPRKCFLSFQTAVVLATLVVCPPNPSQRSLHSSEKKSLSSSWMSMAEAADPSDEMYCGSSWIDAYENCHEPCPSGEDSECTGDGWSCQVYTGCASKIGVNGEENGGTNEDGKLDPYENNFCGVDWIDAMLKCSDPCPPGKQCPEGLFCYAATGCNKPLESHETRLILSLFGAERVMRGEEPTILEELIMSFLKLELEANKVAVNQAEMTKQEAIAEKVYDGLGRNRALNEFDGNQLEDSLGSNSGRETHSALHKNDHNTRGDSKARTTKFLLSLIDFSNNNDQLSTQETSKLTDKPHNEGRRRQLPTTSSALDVSMVVTGDYRPPPYLDLDAIIEDSINRASARLVTDLRERGRRAGTTVFDRLEAVRVVAEERATARPTPKPTLYPTETPTLGPTVDPTSSPTTSPTLSLEQTLRVGFGEDLYGMTGRAFGSIFEVKTRRNAPTVVVQGFDIYTAAPTGSKLFYTIWTIEGTWLGFDGKLDSYTKIAEGEVESAGECVPKNSVEVDDSTNSTSTTTLATGGNATANHFTNTTNSFNEDRNELSPENGEDITASMTAKTSFGEVECNFTQIPLAHFQPVHILGNGKSRSFYITLRSRDMIFSPGSGTDGDTDFKVINSSPEIEVYEGAVGLIYLFGQEIDSAISFSSFRMPRGFLGQVHYHRSPCLDGSTETWPCETRAPVTAFQLTTQKPTLSPTWLPSTSHAPSIEPSLVESEIKVDDDDFDDDTNPKVLKTYDFIRVSTEYGNATGVTNYSSYKPEDLYSTYIILTLESVPNSIMNERECLRYESVMLGYIREQEVLSNVLMDAVSLQLWHQAIVVEEVKKKKPQQTISSSRNKYRAKSRKLQEFTYFNPSASNPNNQDIETTIIIQTTHSTLPLSTASKLLLHVIESPESTLMDDLHDQKIFFSYFEDIDKIHGRLIDQVTQSPTSSPTSYAHFLAMEEEAKAKKPLFTMTLIAAVGLCIGALWCLLTTITVWYLFGARRDMINDKKLFRLEKKGKMTDVNDLESGNINGIDDMKAILEEDTCVSHVTDSLNGSSLTLDKNLSDRALGRDFANRNSSVDNNLNDSVNKRLNELMDKIKITERHESDRANKYTTLLKSLVTRLQDSDLPSGDNEVLAPHVLRPNDKLVKPHHHGSTFTEDAAMMVNSVKKKDETLAKRSSKARMNRQLSSSDIVVSGSSKELITSNTEHKRSSSLIITTEHDSSSDPQLVSISRHLRKYNQTEKSLARSSTPIMDEIAADAAAKMRRGTHSKRRTSKEKVLHSKESSWNTSVKFSAFTEFVHSSSKHTRSKSLDVNPHDRSSHAEDGIISEFVKTKGTDETQGGKNVNEEGNDDTAEFSLNTECTRPASKRNRSRSVDVKHHNVVSPSEGKLGSTLCNLQKQDKTNASLVKGSSPVLLAIASDATLKVKQQKVSSQQSLRERVDTKETGTTAALQFSVNTEYAHSDLKFKRSKSHDPAGQGICSSRCAYMARPSTKDRIKKCRAKNTQSPFSEDSERNKPAPDFVAARQNNCSLSIKEKIRVPSNDKFINKLDHGKQAAHDPDFVMDYITGSSFTKGQSTAPLQLSTEVRSSERYSKSFVVNPGIHSAAVDANSKEQSNSFVFTRAAKATRQTMPTKSTSNKSQHKDIILFGGELHGRRRSLDDARHTLTQDTKSKFAIRTARINKETLRILRPD
ncbi:hypothetical protein ACHAXS_005369 [Conticribra weissflogii]